MSELINVDADLVRELKLKGQGLEAYELIKAHQKIMKKNRENDLIEQRRLSQRRMRFELRKRGLCITCGELIENKKFSRCELCRKKRRKGE